MHRGIGTTRAGRSQESRLPRRTLFDIAWDFSRGEVRFSLLMPGSFGRCKTAGVMPRPRDTRSQLLQEFPTLSEKITYAFLFRHTLR
jgi:hypothetical protein